MIDRLTVDRHGRADLCDPVPGTNPGEATHDRAFADLMAVEAQITADPVHSLADLAAKVLMAFADDATIQMQAAVAADARCILGQITP